MPMRKRQKRMPVGFSRSPNMKQRFSGIRREEPEPRNQNRRPRAQTPCLRISSRMHVRRLSRLKTERRTKIEIERRRAFEGMKGELSGIAMDIASQVIEREVNEKESRGVGQRVY